ncbi:hypothetical protein ACLKA6_010902 [Drosophila palustris]
MFINTSFLLQLTLVSQFYLAYIVNARSQKESITQFGNCSNLFGVPLKLQCTGSVTKALSRNYKDDNVDEGTPYAIFASDSLMLSVFVTMYSSPLMYCNSLTVNERNTFTCDEFQQITLAVSKLFCYHYPMRYFADLRDNCLKARNAAYNAVDHSALHYADESGQASFWSANCWLMLIIALICVCV